MAAKIFPKTLFAKIEEDGDNYYFVSDESADSLVDMGQKIKVGRYQLAEIMTAEGIARFTAAKK